MRNNIHNENRMMKLLPARQVDLDRIINIGKLMDSDPPNANRDVILVVMSLTQQYSEDLGIAWVSRLGRSLQNCLPPLESAVTDLDKVVNLRCG